MHDESKFHAHADATLMHFYDQLEDAFERGDFEELDLLEGLLTIITAEGRTFIISKHAPSMQLWLASPVSGGHHFSFNDSELTWVLPDGKRLKDLLAAELEHICSVKVIF